MQSYKFRYKAGAQAGVWKVYYTLPWEPNEQFVAVSRVGEECWEVRFPTRALGPFRTRKQAATAFIEESLEPVIENMERECRTNWGQTYRPKRMLSPELAGACYDILIEKCRAYAPERTAFIYEQTSEKPTTEWRFGGHLGYGGKFWNVDRLYVSGYPENETVQSRYIVADTNLALLAAFRKHNGV